MASNRPESARTRRFSRALRQWLTVFLICFAAGELTLRTYHHYFPLFVFHDDSYERFRGQPFAPHCDGHKLNSRGFADGEASDQKNGRFRILGLGDSFAFGRVPIPDNYYTLLEEKLKQRIPNVELVNMGIPRTGPKDYLDLLVREGLRLDPDFVIVSFFSGNDFGDDWREDERRPWHSYSFLLSFFRYFLVVEPKLQDNLYWSDTYCDDCPSMEAEAFLKLEYERSFIANRKHELLSKVYPRPLANLRAIGEACRSRGIPLVVVIIPDELQVSPRLQQEVRARYYPALSDDDWDWARPNKLLTRDLMQLEIPALDLYWDFAQAGRSERLYKPQDTHWNLAGNRLAAETIFPFLLEQIGEGTASTTAER